MGTIEDFIKYRDHCPICNDLLGIVLYKGIGNLSLIQDNDHFVYRRIASNRIVDGGGIDYVADVYFSANNNDMYVEFSEDLYSDSLESVPLRIITNFRDYEAITTSPYIITNACYECNYEYSAEITIDWKKSQFTVGPIKTEIFLIYTSDQNDWFSHNNYAIVNNLCDESSQILKNLDSKAFTLRHITNRVVGKFERKYISALLIGEVIDLPGFYCDPTKPDQLEKELDVLYLFS